jgi:subtilisin family serine protease
VHVADPKIKDVVAANPGMTASLKATDTTGAALPPVPQIAEFSSRGPTLASDGDLLKPDVAAPGVAVLAAVSPIGFKGENFGFLSGTSMAAPHIARSGALLLGKNPQWSPAAVKSAIMTTAYDLVNADGAEVHDVFAQGAGEVDPSKFASPGLVYDAGIADWMGFLQGQGIDLGVAPVAAKDVNVPSVALGALAGSQTVKRTVTAVKGGTYSAAVDVPGIKATVSPAEVTLKEGESATFTITFATAGAPLNAYATASLTWTSSDNSVRSPVAVRPVAP